MSHIRLTAVCVTSHHILLYDLVFYQNTPPMSSLDISALYPSLCRVHDHTRTFFVFGPLFLYCHTIP
ncbi:hypothetical protein HBI56_196770 [Parastagonospora nodorum]|nr:hypothetical protein HBH56_208730 [Parastagonospora nodorum]KAH3923655.1 hypothetical protein HBH54_207600 [Parastagonospora nodorum]KAH3941547.1 hypothetical protein HBH53_199220 [Parastagonospora nodorum]KAH3960484.1 hypothetical protein HBH51_192120 [Parastagonospora nodorum]KAH3965137.1 hypothetical protein HBH52_206990 [Parastagonospora nodorum]